jgi:hypothetical protein
MSNATEVFIDCEFNSFQGKLISMALVGIDGREMYCCVPMEDEVDGWVAENVMPIIAEKSEPEYVELDRLPYRIAEFLSEYDAVHLVADWPDDVRHFCDQLITGPGYRVDTPPLTMEIRRDLDAESLVPHNALHDARGIRDLYLSLISG